MRPELHAGGGVLPATGGGVLPATGGAAAGTLVGGVAGAEEDGLVDLRLVEREGQQGARSVALRRRQRRRHGCAGLGAPQSIAVGFFGENNQEATGKAVGGADLEARDSAPPEAGRNPSWSGRLPRASGILRDLVDMSAGENRLKRFSLTSGKRR